MEYFSLIEVSQWKKFFFSNYNEVCSSQSILQVKQYIFTHNFNYENMQLYYNIHFIYQKKDQTLVILLFVTILNCQ